MGEGAQNGANLGAGSVDVVQDLAVLEAQDANPRKCQLLASDLVVVQTIGMLVLRAIQLECEASLGAVEVEDESPQCVLSPELETIESPPTQTCPKQLLCWRAVST